MDIYHESKRAKKKVKEEIDIENSGPLDSYYDSKAAKKGVKEDMDIEDSGPLSKPSMGTNPFHLLPNPPTISSSLTIFPQKSQTFYSLPVKNTTHVTIYDAMIYAINVDANHKPINATGYAERLYKSKMALIKGPQDYLPSGRSIVEMDESQFVRFKNAGKRSASKLRKFWGNEDRTRQDRTRSDTLRKWDVAPYKDLVGRTGPWGDGSKTNRDHMPADSSNQLRVSKKGSLEVKNLGWAITVSGKHHREGSWTYGGRTKKRVEGTLFNRTEFGAYEPAESLYSEFAAMFGHKVDAKVQVSKPATLRVEMVGAYAYFYRMLVRNGYPAGPFLTTQKLTPSEKMDELLLTYLKIAVKSDDGKLR